MPALGQHCQHTGTGTLQLTLQPSSPPFSQGLENFWLEKNKKNPHPASKHRIKKLQITSSLDLSSAFEPLSLVLSYLLGDQKRVKKTIRVLQ